LISVARDATSVSIETTRAWSGKLGKPLVLDGDITSANHTLALGMRRDTVLEGLWADPPWEWRKRKQRYW